MDILGQKTVIVLNHTEEFLQKAVDINLDVKKSEPNSRKLIYEKVLWSCVVDACLEYVRIVFDLFETTRGVCNYCPMFFRSMCNLP